MRRLSIYRPCVVLVLGISLLLPACRLVSPSPNPISPKAPSTALLTPTPIQGTATLPAEGTQAAGVSVTLPPQDQPLVPGVAGQEPAMLPSASADLTSLGELNHYDIKVDIDYTGHSFTGSQKVDITNRETVPLDRLYFRLLPNGGKSYGGGSLDVSRLTVNGQPVQGELSLSDSVLEVPLAQPLQVGERVQVGFDFSGVVPVDFGADSNGESGYGIYNYSDGVLALSGWYPILAVYDDQGWNLDPVSAIGDSVYSDTAYYTVEVTLPEDVVLATTGVQVKDGNTRAYVSGPVRDFFMAMSSEYQVASQDVGGVDVNSYFLPGHEAGGEKALEVAGKSLQVFDERFGIYPYKELDVVEAPMQMALGVEYPGIVLVTSDEYDDPSQMIFDITTAHEVSHQWWYGVVGNDVFDEPWLDEALATYSSDVYLQQAMGQSYYDGYRRYWVETLDNLRAEGNDDVVTESLSYFEDPSKAASYGGVVYDKGALFFDALRKEIGDEAFFSALQSYYRNHKYGVARTKDLLSALDAAAGRPLDDFYQEWLYSAQK